MTARYAHVVLDWDGTVVDTLHDKARNAAQVLSAALGAPAAAIEAAYLRHSGVARRVLFDRIASDTAARALSDPEFERLSAEFTSVNLARLAPAALQPGAEAALYALARRGVRLALSSSAPPEDLDPRVERSGLRPLFDAVLASRPGFAKGPEHVASLCARWAVSPADLLAVGDEAADVALARAAGANVALVLHTLGLADAQGLGPDHVLAGLEDLLLLCPPRA